MLDDNQYDSDDDLIPDSFIITVIVLLLGIYVIAGVLFLTGV